MTNVTNLPIGGLSAGARADGPDAAQRQQIALAAREFEAMFLMQMLRQMRQSMLSEEPDGEGLGASTMIDTVDGELARHLSGQPGGLYDVIAKAFSGEVAVSPSPLGTVAPPMALESPVEIAPLRPASAPGSGEAAKTTVSAELQLPEGRVSSKFGWRNDPFTGASKFHKGVDIAAAYGEEVAAAGAGRVVFAGVQGAYGKTVVVEHEGGLQTRYAHLSQLDVSQGDAVSQGGAIGRVGRSGRATGAHLHFELLEDGRPVNPMRAAELNRALKVAGGAADYPTGITRTGVPTGVDHEN